VAATALLLCHRRRNGVAGSAFFEEWAAQRAKLVGECGDALGWSDYYQVHRVGRWNLVYRAIRLTRSWPVTAVLSLARGLAPYALVPRDVRVAEERFDLVEVFAWPDATALDAALNGGGKPALKRLADDAAPRARRTTSILGERVETAVEPGERPAGVVTMFCLRPRPALTAEAMLTYWLDDHGPFVAGLRRALGYSRYEQFAARAIDEAQALATTSHPAPPFAGVAALAYPDFASLARGLVNPATQIANARLVWDELSFLDAARSALVLGRIRHRLDRCAES